VVIFSVQIVNCSVHVLLAGSAIDIMLTHDHADNAIRH